MANTNPDYLVIIKQAADPSVAGSTGITVTANLPESFAFDSSADYATPFAQGLFNGSGALAQIAAVNGKRLTAQALTAQIWQGSNESDLMLDFDFYSDTDPQTDVIQPVLNLLRLTAPSIDPTTGMLKSPGPRIDLGDTAAILSALGNQLTNSASQVATAAQNFPNAKPGTMNAENANISSSGASNTPPTAQAGAGGADFWKGKISNQISVRIGRYAFFDSVVIKNVQKTYDNELDAQTGIPYHVKVSVRFAPLTVLTQDDIIKIFASQS
jgi:hypothetical protein